MLKTLKCNAFEKKETIFFNKGLNIIKGDKAASNSIGKSTFLMIIDFILGGSNYLSHDGGAISIKGNHTFEYSFDFDDDNYYFIRKTDDSDNIYLCDPTFQELDKITIDKYRKFLKEKYKLNDISNSFRDIISLYIRVWGRENLNPKMPLESFSKETQESSVNRVIKLFKKYFLIEESVKLYKETNSDSTALNRLLNKEYIKKITKPKYDENKRLISQLNQELEGMKKELEKGMLNFEDIKNKSLLEKFEMRKNLTQKKSLIDIQLKNLEKAKLKKTSISVEILDKIYDFFPNINKNKLIDIELFHSNLSQVLKSQINSSLKTLKDEKNIIIDEIEVYNNKINNLQNETKVAPETIERLGLITTALETLKKENKNYDLKIDLSAKVKEYKEDKIKKKVHILDEISGQLNYKIKEVSKEISKKLISPSINFTEKGYKFETAINTGTGKAYDNFIIYDLAILELTELPLLVHDSILFKNIELLGTENILNKYNKFKEKQIFISIDEITRYADDTQKLILDTTVISVSKEKPLFGINWGDNEFK